MDWLADILDYIINFLKLSGSPIILSFALFLAVSGVLKIIRWCIYGISG